MRQPRNSADPATRVPGFPGVVEGVIVADDVLRGTDGRPPVAILEAGDLEGLEPLIGQGSVYVNVHTDDHAGGEVRGQMSPRVR